MDARDLTEERMALNESLVREANERIERAAEKMDLFGSIPFICECAAEDCMEIVRLTFEGYDEIRRDPRLFFCVPGHEALAVETGAACRVREGDAYVVVEKIGVAGEIAAQEYRRLHHQPRRL
jgi:hypothetical protein